MAAKVDDFAAFLDQDPHATGSPAGRMLEEAIGREAKHFREKLGLTISELAKAAGMSAGMLSPGHAPATVSVTSTV